MGLPRAGRGGRPDLGRGRAAFSKRRQSAARAGIPITLHHDAPIQAPAILPLVWAAVTHTDLSGPAERLTPYQALQAVTRNAAYQIHEEATRGTLKPGKLADLVLLDRNPLKVDPMTIKDIEVIETIKEGKSVYRREPATGR